MIMAVILRTGSLFRLSKVVPVFGLRCASSLKVKVNCIFELKFGRILNIISILERIGCGCV